MQGKKAKNPKRGGWQLLFAGRQNLGLGFYFYGCPNFYVSKFHPLLLCVLETPIYRQKCCWVPKLGPQVKMWPPTQQLVNKSIVLNFGLSKEAFGMHLGILVV